MCNAILSSVPWQRHAELCSFECSHMWLFECMIQKEEGTGTEGKRPWGDIKHHEAKLIFLYRVSSRKLACSTTLPRAEAKSPTLNSWAHQLHRAFQKFHNKKMNSNSKKKKIAGWRDTHYSPGELQWQLFKFLLLDQVQEKGCLTSQHCIMILPLIIKYINDVSAYF